MFSFHGKWNGCWFGHDNGNQSFVIDNESESIHGYNSLERERKRKKSDRFLVWLSGVWAIYIYMEMYAVCVCCVCVWFYVNTCTEIYAA